MPNTASTPASASFPSSGKPGAPHIRVFCECLGKDGATAAAERGCYAQSPLIAKYAMSGAPGALFSVVVVEVP